MLRQILIGLSGPGLLIAGDASAQSVTRRDSAGVHIVEVPATALAALPTWRLEGPTVRIGPDKGGLEYEFNYASSPWRLTDGRIVMANNQAELRFFDSTGRYLNTVGRRGRGPGEYEQLLRVFRIPGDTLLVWEFPMSRIDVRDATGKLVKSFTIPRASVFAGLGGKGAVFEEYQLPDRRKRGVRQDTVVLRQLHPDGTAGAVVARLPGGWTEILSNYDWRGVPLSGGMILAGNTRSTVYVQGDAFTAYWFGDNARLETITRVQLPRTRVTAAEKRGDEQRRSDLAARNPQVRVDPGQAPPAYGSHLPQVTRVVIDIEGRAWVRRPWTPSGSSARTSPPRTS